MALAEEIKLYGLFPARQPPQQMSARGREAEAGMWNTAQGVISALSVLHERGKSTFDLQENGLTLFLFQTPASPKKIQLFSDVGGVVALLDQRHKPGSFLPHYLMFPTLLFVIGE